MIEFDRWPVNYRWRPVEARPGLPYRYPAGISEHVKNRHSHAEVYRWAFLKNKKLWKAYIGEAENLASRLRGYLWPNQSQQTNWRLKQEFELWMANGHEVELQVLEFDPFCLNRVVVTHGNLGDTYIRRMIENFLIADNDNIHCELLNAKLNPIERRQRKAASLKGRGFSRAVWSRKKSGFSR